MGENTAQVPRRLLGARFGWACLAFNYALALACILTGIAVRTRFAIDANRFIPLTLASALLAIIFTDLLSVPLVVHAHHANGGSVTEVNTFCRKGGLKGGPIEAWGAGLFVGPFPLVPTTYRRDIVRRDLEVDLESPEGHVRVFWVRHCVWMWPTTISLIFVGLYLLASRVSHGDNSSGAGYYSSVLIALYALYRVGVVFKHDENLDLPA